MNTTKWTNKDLESIIKLAFKLTSELVIITSSSYCNESLVEFSYNEPIIIEDVEGKGIININFRQEIEAECGYECCGAFTYSYNMIIDKKTIDNLHQSLETIK